MIIYKKKENTMAHMTQKKLFDTIEFFFSEKSYYIPSELSITKLKEWWDYYVNTEYKHDIEAFKIFCGTVLFIKTRLQ